MEIFVDAFHLGEVLFAEDCQERLTQIYSGHHCAAGTSGGGRLPTILAHDAETFTAGRVGLRFERARTTLERVIAA